MGCGCGHRKVLAIECAISEEEATFVVVEVETLGAFIKETLNKVIKGWINYFKLAEVKTFAKDLDGWIRRRLRNIKWRQWKRPWKRK